MKKLTLDSLRKHRADLKKELRPDGARAATSSVVIGMGTCGVAAGAKPAHEAFISELEACGLKNVEVKPTGCMGLCHSEPTVEVIHPGMPRVIYGRVNAEVARRIVREHLVGGRLVDGHVYDQPALDIVPHLTAPAR